MNVTFTVAAIAPTITFAVANHTYGDAPFAVSATSNATGAFTYSVVSGPATISGSTVTLTGAGTVVLNAADNPKLSGQQRIYVFENGHIVMPYGSVGLKWEYRWKDGVFQTEELYDPLRRLYAL